jgi:hypothetical protein
MDPRRNPFAPGAGTPPPELAGRDRLIETVSIALDRIQAGRAAQSPILYGLRGVGKTVLLSAMRRNAEASGMTVIAIEAPEQRSLPAVLAPALRTALLRLDRLRGTSVKVQRALSALAGFIKLKAQFGDLFITLEHDSEPGLADSGDLEADLTDLIRALGEAAKDRQTAAVLFVDELQYVPDEQLAALIVALHAANQNQLPVTMVGAGLPQLLGQMGRAKSYAERLFSFEMIGPLDRDAAEAALRNPIEQEGEQITPAAIENIYAATEGYAYFLQEWGKQCWDIAEQSPITADHVADAQAAALSHLDDSFFRVRLDRLTPSERRYVFALANLGPGAHRSGDIAQMLDVKVTTVAPTRSSLIQKGMVYSPGHGDTAFTVPMFDAFIRRTMDGPL